MKSFDKCLKYVPFKVTREENVGLTSTTVAENQRHEGRETAFSVMMTASAAKKFPVMKNDNANGS